LAEAEYLHLNISCNLIEETKLLGREKKTFPKTFSPQVFFQILKTEKLQKVFIVFLFPPPVFSWEAAGVIPVPIIPARLPFY